MMMVRPPEARARRVERSFRAVVESSPDVGWRKKGMKNQGQVNKMVDLEVQENVRERKRSGQGRG